MKFQTNDILENRNGTQVVVIHVNHSTQEYHYKYLNVSDPQFQGMFCHKADDIEQYWNLVPANKHQNLVLATSSHSFHNEEQSKSRLHRKPQSCAHEVATYVGFTETYKYCKKCDEKFSV